MKSIISGFFRHFFANPVMPLLVILCSISAMLLTADDHSEIRSSDIPEYVRTTVPVRLTSDRTATTTSATSQTTTTLTTTTTTTTEPTDTTSAASDSTSTETASAEQGSERPPLSNYTVYVGAESPNSAYYQERLTILGDSIAYGFNAYGYIPYEHNIAKESMALWNISKYTFDLGGGSMGAVDAAVYSDSPLIYISIGMNDIFIYSTDDYAARVYSLADELVASIPDTTVVIGSITPVSANNYYTTNATIDSFNSALENYVNSCASPQILYFNANAVLKDPNTGALSSSVSGGDGLHISGASYGYILNALFNYLDTTDTLDRMHRHDEKYE